MGSSRFTCFVAIGVLAGPLACSSPKDALPDAAPPATSASVTAAQQGAATTAPPPTRLGPSYRQGAAIARSLADDALLVADEDHKSLRRIPLPLAPDAAITTTEMPGAPAAVLPLSSKILVTIRDPGLLLVLQTDASGKFVEANRITLPPDAWGIAVSADATSAFVTSARHAVGALARRSWFGQPTVDVVLLSGKSGRTASEQLSAIHLGGLLASQIVSFAKIARRRWLR